MKDIRCTHGCTHYHPKEDDNHKCDVHHWAWKILDTDLCKDYDGKRWHPPKPKKIKQPKTGWQTGIAVFQDFPYRCQSFQDNQRSHVDIGECGVAFNCDCFPAPGMKGQSEECEGMACPHCRLVGIEKYEENIKKTT